MTKKYKFNLLRGRNLQFLYNLYEKKFGMQSLYENEHISSLILEEVNND